MAVKRGGGYPPDQTKHLVLLLYVLVLKIKVKLISGALRLSKLPLSSPLPRTFRHTEVVEVRTRKSDSAM